ncbi:MAG: cyclase family protein [Methanoculleaceae archaeon]
MAIHDITRPLSPSIQVYPGDVIPSLTEERRGFRITRLTLGSHSGTHIDAPRHYLEDGTSIDRLPLTHFCGPVDVIDCRHLTCAIGPEDLEVSPGIRRILIRTWYSGVEEFDPSYPYLTPEAADHLVSRGIWCVGVDTPSVEVFEGDGTVHRRLLSGGVIPVELLDLSGVEAGRYWMVALPLKLAGVDGAPARVILADDIGDLL